MHIDKDKLQATLVDLSNHVGGVTGCCEVIQQLGEVDGKVVLIHVMTKDEAKEQGFLDKLDNPIIVI